MEIPIYNKFFRSHTIFLLFFQIFLVILAYFILITPLSITAQQQVLIDPEEIKITISEKELNKVRDTRIYLSPIQSNISNVKVLSTDLKSDQENWIESSKIKVNPNKVNLLSGQVSNLTLNFDGLDSKPGIYSGNLFLTSPALTTIRIPLTVTIHSDAWIALFLVGLGVITNFLLKFFQLKVKEKEKANQLLDVAIMEHNQVTQLKSIRPLAGAPAQLQYNVSSSKMADDKINEAINNFNYGYFHESIVTAKESLRFLAAVVLPEQPPLQAIRRNVSLIHKVFWFLTPPVRADYAAYAGLTLALLISVLLVWQQYFSKLSVFGVFPIDYIAAFLFGFGSQAILISEILDFAKIIKD
jgi:hypothetical protein